jgi:hypothetical protein
MKHPATPVKARKAIQTPETPSDAMSSGHQATPVQYPQKPGGKSKIAL